MVNDVVAYTETAGAVAIKAADTLTMPIVKVGGDGPVRPGETIWFNLNNHQHILAMHKLKLRGKVRYRDPAALPFDITDHPLKMLEGSTAAYIDTHIVRSGDLRRMETITHYGEVVNSAMRHQQNPFSYDTSTMFNVNPLEAPHVWYLYTSDPGYADGSWSKPMEQDIPIYNGLTANGECYFPTMNLTENFAFGFTMASNGSAFTPFGSGDGSVMPLNLETDPLNTTHVKIPGQSQDLGFSTRDYHFEYMFEYLNIIAEGVELQFGADDVRFRPWYFDTIETQVFTKEVGDGAELSMEISPDRTSVTSIRAALCDPRSYYIQTATVLPQRVHPRGAFYGSKLDGDPGAAEGVIQWYRFTHLKRMFPNYGGTGKERPPDKNENIMYFIGSKDRYMNQLSSTVYLGERSLQPFTSKFTPLGRSKTDSGLTNTSYLYGFYDPLRRDYTEALPYRRIFTHTMLGGKTQAFVPKFDARFPNSKGEHAQERAHGGDFWMYMSSGIFNENPHIIEGLNTTLSKSITLQIERESAIRTGGKTEPLGYPGEEVQIEHVQPMMMAIVHNSYSYLVDNGVVSGAY